MAWLWNYTRKGSRFGAAPFLMGRRKEGQGERRVAGLCFGAVGMFFCEDATVCARVYGYCDGTVVEFCLGIACIVIATVSLYIAGMLRDRRIQAEFARRRVERERRRAERENRGW